MPNQYYCRMCGRKIDRWTYSNAKFCSDRCRVRNYRELKRIKHMYGLKSAEAVTEQEA